MKDKKNFYLVMRQKVSTAQGPDIIVLREKDGTIFLDLFQCKHLQKMPDMNWEKFTKCFWSLGVTFGKGKRKEINVEPTSGSAGYSYLGIKVLAEKLHKRLSAPVEIGDRILVFSKEWDDEKSDADFLKQAIKKGVMVWTKEMLEPTISALCHQPGNDNSTNSPY